MVFKLLQILSTVDTSQCHKQNPVIGGEEEAGWSHRAARVRILKWCLYAVAEIWPEYYSKTNSVNLNNFLQFGKLFLRKYFQSFASECAPYWWVPGVGAELLL